MVGCSLGPSRLWFTIGGGIVNEVYYPRVDIPQIRDLGFIVARRPRVLGGGQAAVAAHRDASPRPASRRCGSCTGTSASSSRCASPPCGARRAAHRGDADRRCAAAALCAARAAPGRHGHRQSRGSRRLSRPARAVRPSRDRSGWRWPRSTPEQQDAFGRASAGYVGASDGWQDFARNGAMTWEYAAAGPGNVALIGELPRACGPRARLRQQRGVGRDARAAPRCSSRSSAPATASIDAWTRLASPVAPPAEELTDDLPAECAEQFQLSAMVLRAHQDKTYPGAMVASLSVPWGNTKEEREGYHLVWPRDLVRVRRRAARRRRDARSAATRCATCVATQLAGRALEPEPVARRQAATGPGVQLDETAFPVLLAALARRARRARGHRGRRHGPARALLHRAHTDRRAIRTAGRRTRDSTPSRSRHASPRWSPARRTSSRDARELALAFADYWNARLEDWTAVRDTPLARRYGVPGYYVRVAPPRGRSTTAARCERVLPIKNQALDPGLPAAAQFGVDFLQLVRFGLRRADDPLIVGERAARGRAAQGRHAQRPLLAPLQRRRLRRARRRQRRTMAPARGRAWPLLTGERGHYEIVRRPRSAAAIWSHGAHGLARAACCPSRSGTPRPSPHAACARRAHRRRRCRSPGRTRST